MGKALRVAPNSDRAFDPWLERELVCPRDKSDLRRDGEQLVCQHLHNYPIVDGIPVMLIDDVPQTLPDLTQRSLAAAASTSADALPRGETNGAVESFVQEVIVGTNGNLYGRIAGKLPRYPIPEMRLPPAREGARALLDLGCNWGRWSIAAARRGYRPVGMDPGLESILPARRIARQLGIEARFLVGDARYIPFRDGRFEVVYSYGVLQNFSPADARLAIAEAARVVAPGGTVSIQMAARYGLLSIFQQARRGFRDARGFEVRYWKPSDIEAAFRSLIGPTMLSADGYLTLNGQPSDLDLLPFHSRQIVRLSETIRSLSRRIPALLNIADSIFATSMKNVAAPDAESRKSA
jgi:SAM-dependent methyltransferase